MSNGRFPSFGEWQIEKEREKGILVFLDKGEKFRKTQNNLSLLTDDCDIKISSQVKDGEYRWLLIEVSPKGSLDRETFERDPNAPVCCVKTEYETTHPNTLFDTAKNARCLLQVHSRDYKRKKVFIVERGLRSCHLNEAEYNDPDYCWETDSSNKPASFSVTHGVLKEYQGAEETVVIPDNVTEIGDYALQAYRHLTGVVIPNGVVKIGEWAFDSCSDLKSVTIPDSVTEIGRGAFAYCESLTDVILPNGIDEISEYAFYHCVALTSITLPNRIKRIKEFAFCGCDCLTAVEIPDRVNHIDRYAFSYCEGLTSVTIPNHVKHIGNSAFCGCKLLTAVMLPDGLESIEDDLFSGCKELTNISIPERVKSIGKNAFENCERLTSVTIPDGVTSIGEGAFSDCHGLTSITIPKHIMIIEKNTFKHCGELTSITIPDDVTSIGEGAFSDCRKLTSITIPKHTKSIGEDAFWGCSGLKSIRLPVGLQLIDYSAFGRCDQLETVYFDGTKEQKDSIQIRSGYGYGNGGNDCLQNVEWVFGAPEDSEPPKTEQTVSSQITKSQAEAAEGIPDAGETTTQETLNNDLTEDVVMIGEKPYPVEDVLSLTKDTIYIRFDKLLERFTVSAQYKEIRIPDRIYGQPVCQTRLSCYKPSPIVTKKPVGEVWRGRMQDPNDYETVYQEIKTEVKVHVYRLIVPNSIKEFSGFSYGSVEYGNPQSNQKERESRLTAAQAGTQERTDQEAKNSQTSYQKYEADLMSRGGVKDDYTKCPKCGKALHRQDTRCGWCGAHIERQETEKTVASANEAAKTSAAAAASPFIIKNSVLNQYRGDDKSVIIPDGITEIGYRAFSNCSNLSSVAIPAGVTKIGSRAFDGCANLTEITIPDSVTSVGSGVFGCCRSLTAATIRAQVTSVSDSMFWDCRSLRVISLPASVTSVGFRAFFHCESLETVCYDGTEDQRKGIHIEDGNESLLNAEWVFGAPEDSEPSEKE